MSNVGPQTSDEHICYEAAVYTNYDLICRICLKRRGAHISAYCVPDNGSSLYLPDNTLDPARYRGWFHVIGSGTCAKCNACQHDCCKKK
jgi:hypothetical protein